jgi:hypothetical protein
MMGHIWATLTVAYCDRFVPWEYDYHSMASSQACPYVSLSSAENAVKNEPQVMLHGGRGNTETLFERETTRFYSEIVEVCILR